MNRIVIAFSALVYCGINCLAAQTEFTDGVFILNEDWYGHNQSTINFWNRSERYVDYNIFEIVNPGRTLGCTSQYGQIFGRYMIIVSKQSLDPGSGAENPGGRVVVADKKTLRCLASIENIAVNGKGQSVADGRAVVGVTPEKAYVGSSNGIYVLNLKTYMIDGVIPGTENPLVDGSEVNSDGQGPLYQNQIGKMIRGQDYVFAIYQDKGVLVIDPVHDQVIEIVPGCFSTMTQTPDGAIWVGTNVAEGENEFGVSFQHYPYGESGNAWKGTRLTRIDQYTLETTCVDLPEAGVAQSWYAWTAGMLNASTKENRLFTIYNSPEQGQVSWFTVSHLYRYDIPGSKIQEIENSADDDIYFYGGSCQVSPVDDMLYCCNYVGNNIAAKNWVYRVLDHDGKVIDDCQLIDNYWYPAMFIFPDNEPWRGTGVPEEIEVGAEDVVIPLADKVTDSDTPTFTIVKRIADVSDPSVVSASVIHGNLVLRSVMPGTSQVTVDFDSNGMVTSCTIQVRTTHEVSAVDEIYVDGGKEPVEWFDINGRCINPLTASPGLYIRRQGSKISKVKL